MGQKIALEAFSIADLYRNELTPGWSRESQLSLPQQLWLDPYRSEFDYEFALVRAGEAWRKSVSNQFASWMNSNLSGLPVGDTEHDFWCSISK